jgi:anti-sigma-K factor RskA
LAHAERYAELAALAALGILDGDDRQEFERHIARGCPDCEKEQRETEMALSLLGRTAPERPPSALLRNRILREAQNEKQRWSRSATRTRAVSLLAAAACVLLALSLAIIAGQRRQRDKLALELEQAQTALARQELRVRFLDDPDIQMMLLSGIGPQPGARGKVIYSPRARRAIILATNLAPLASDRQYELWFIAGGKPVAAGVFEPRAGAPTVFESEMLPSGAGLVEKFAVTVEPRGGVPQPTGPMVLVGPA